MPLPQQVINQLSQDTPETPGWSSGVIVFSAAILVVVFAIYFFLLFVYGPYLNSNLTTTQNKIDTLDQSIASGDQASLIAFYSEVTNLQSVLSNHVAFSQVLAWLQQNTEANVYYSSFSFSAGDEMTLTGIADSEADINEQLAIFEAAPLVQNVNISNIALSGTSGLWTFSASLIMDPSILSVNNASTTTP